MRYKITHVTEYAYQDPVGLCHNRLCLTPLDDLHQACISTDIKVMPVPEAFVYRRDFFGNTVAFLYYYNEQDHLGIKCVSEVEMYGSF